MRHNYEFSFFFFFYLRPTFDSEWNRECFSLISIANWRLTVSNELHNSVLKMCIPKAKQSDEVIYLFIQLQFFFCLKVYLCYSIIQTYSNSDKMNEPQLLHCFDT